MLRYGWLTGTAALLLGGVDGAIAQQVLPDSSLGLESSQVTGAQTLEIRGGAQRGENLFHSFQDFGIGAGQSGFFIINDPAIETVLARVTGTQRSDILGTLGIRTAGTVSQPPTDLFLINPNGVFFGPNANLNLGGSFAATTSTEVQFGNQGIFSATQPATVPLLTVQPSAFGFSQATPASIAVQAGEINLLGEPSGLVVEDGQQIMLVAGEISLDSGVLIAQNGRLDLAALAAPGRVELPLEQGLFKPKLLASQPRADISILGRSGLNVSAERGGDILIQANDLQVDDGSLILSGVDRPSAGNAIGSLFSDLLLSLLPSLLGPIAGQPDNLPIDSIRDQVTNFLGSAGEGGDGTASGDVVIDATGLVQLAGASIIANGTLFAQDGGGIRISGREIELLDGSNIGAVGNGSGGTQDIVIEADESILVSGLGGSNQFEQILDSLFGNSLPFGISLSELLQFNNLDLEDLFSQATETTPALEQLLPGIGGDRPSAIVNYVAPISALGATAGDNPVAGNIILKAPSVLLKDGGIGTPNLGDGGDTGDIQILANRLEVTDGARLIANANGQSNGGHVSIAPFQQDLLTVSQVELNGPGVEIQTNLNPQATGQAGDITITSDEILILNGAALISASLGNGKAGDIQLRGNDRIVLNQGILLAGGGRENDSAATAGAGGDVALSTAVLELQDSLLRSATFGQGNAGNIRIEASDRLSNRSSEISTRVAASATGTGGDISILAGEVEMLNNARLLTNTLGQGDAGDIEITSTGPVVFRGLGLGDRPGSSVAFSRVNTGAIGDGGDVRIQADQLSLLDGAQIAAATEGDGNSGAVNIVVRKTAILDGFNPLTGVSSGILTNNGTPRASGSTIGTGFGGDIDLTAAGLTLSNSAVLNARTANDQLGGNITLDLNDLQILSGAQIISTSDASGSAGTVQFNATNGAQIAGQDLNYATRTAQFGANVAPLSAHSGIRLRSTGTGNAGNLIVGNPIANGLTNTTPTLRLQDTAEIIADSNAANGGNITLNIPQVILMENGSLISASAGRAQGAGNGGNIIINSASVLASPDGNNDIIANAFSGTGGTITVEADAIQGFVKRPDQPDVALLRANTTNDITVNAEPAAGGQPGQLELDNFNVDPSQGAAELPVDLTDPSSQISTACRPSNIARNEFVLTGRSGLPLNPREPQDVSQALSSWVNLPTAIAQPAQASSAQIASPPHSPKQLLEASSWSLDSTGQVQLIAEAMQVVKSPAYNCSTRR